MKARCARGASLHRERSVLFILYLCRMLYPPNFEQKLGFDQIRQMLADRCLSKLGRENVGKITFSVDPSEIQTMLLLTSEMKRILEFEEGFPSQDYYDLIPELFRIRIEGSYLEPEQLSELKLSLQTIVNLLSFLKKRKENYPTLFQLSILTNETDPHCERSEHSYSLANEVSFYHEQSESSSCIPHLASIIKKITSLIDEKSNIRDNASNTLLKIRREKISKLASVERKVIQSFKLARQNGWTPDDADITIRNGRLVIPLASTHKRKIPGFLHDESATGQTVYIEPAEIFEINNEIRELEYAERREIVRILTAFAETLRPGIDDLIRCYGFLGQIDFLRAKGLFAIEIDASKPILDKKRSGPILDNGGSTPIPESGSSIQHRQRSEFSSGIHQLAWHHAIHPILFLSHKKQKKKVVPLDISLDEGQRILIISGPNAGGKSVCLKTVGLLQYMFQCGLLPPVKEDSEFCIFRKIFIDIGDEQSIDNDLSTYSSKLLNLKYFIEHLDEHSLFLIDELGAGTDPSLGGAIAEATLERLNAKGAFGIVTTHYSNLKLLAGREQGIMNGAMLFDLKKLKPLYQLKTGKPGSSFAFEIARQIGFPEELLENARMKTGVSHLDFDRELQNLEVEKQQITRKEEELNIADDLLGEVIRKYRKLTEDLEKTKTEILENAREEARQLFDDSNKLIERTIKEIRESQADKTKTKKVRAELTQMKEKLKHDPSSGIQHRSRSELTSSIANEVSKGREQSELLSSGKTPKHPYQSYIDDLHQKLLSFELTLDLRGKRVDEALSLLQRYIDDATLLSLNEVRILHGKGNGVLRQVTRDYLRSRKEVKSAKDELLERGGSGITVVTF